MNAGSKIVDLLHDYGIDKVTWLILLATSLCCLEESIERKPPTPTPCFTEHPIEQELVTCLTVDPLLILRKHPGIHLNLEIVESTNNCKSQHPAYQVPPVGDPPLAVCCPASSSHQLAQSAVSSQ